MNAPELVEVIKARSVVANINDMMWHNEDSVRTNAADVGTRGRWFMDPTTGVIIALARPGLTGKDIIIDIIDTEIDIQYYEVN